MCPDCGASVAAIGYGSKIVALSWHPPCCGTGGFIPMQASLMQEGGA